MNRKIVNPWQWQNQYGFSQGVLIEGSVQQLFCAGQGAVDAAGKAIAPGDMAAQIAHAWDNVRSVLEHAGWQLSSIVQVRVYTTDVDLFLAHEKIWSACLEEIGHAPAQSLLGIDRLAFNDMMVEIEVFAVQPA